MDQMNSVTSAVSTFTSKPTIANGRIAWVDGAAKKQYFSLPDNIIYYMIKNPSTPKVYLKLGMSCKYFFEKLPLLSDFFLKVGRIYDGGKKFCSNEKESECRMKNYECCTYADLAEITKSNIWLTGSLSLTGTYDPSLASTLVPKLFECQDAVIRLWNTKMTMEEFKLWGTKFTKFTITGGKITDANGSSVMIDSMLEALANVKEFCYWFTMFSHATPAVNSETMKNILKLKNLDKLVSLFFMDPPEILLL